MRFCSTIRHIALHILALGTLSSSLHAVTLIYYNGASSGTSVTNLGTLGASGTGTITTTGTGSVTTVTTGGPSGTEDSYLNLVSNASAGGWVTVPTAGLPNFRNNNWSISGFFNRTNSDTIDNIFHMGNGDNSGGENELYLYGSAGSTNTRLEHFPGNGFSLQSSRTLNTWHSYAVTFAASGASDGAGTLSLYLDGALIGSTTNFNFTTTGSPAGIQSLLQLGGIGYGTNTTNANRGFTGGLDEFAFYDLVLNSTEVSGLHNRTLTPLQVVPEPSRALMLIIASLGLVLRRKR